LEVKESSWPEIDPLLNLRVFNWKGFYAQGLNSYRIFSLSFGTPQIFFVSGCPAPGGLWHHDLSRGITGRCAIYLFALLGSRAEETLPFVGNSL
jgi:hypothetical protein